MAYVELDGEWEECGECGGDGLILDECFEDTCCCADPSRDHDLIDCSTCHGNGGWFA